MRICVENMPIQSRRLQRRLPQVNPQSLEAADEDTLRQHLAETVAFCRAALDGAGVVEG